MWAGLAYLASAEGTLRSKSQVCFTLHALLSSEHYSHIYTDITTVNTAKASIETIPSLSTTIPTVIHIARRAIGFSRTTLAFTNITDNHIRIHTVLLASGSSKEQASWDQWVILLLELSFTSQTLSDAFVLNLASQFIYASSQRCCLSGMWLWICLAFSVYFASRRRSLSVWCQSSTGQRSRSKVGHWKHNNKSSAYDYERIWRVYTELRTRGHLHRELCILERESIWMLLVSFRIRLAEGSKSTSRQPKTSGEEFHLSKSSVQTKFCGC